MASTQAIIVTDDRHLEEWPHSPTLIGKWAFHYPSADAPPNSVGQIEALEVVDGKERPALVNHLDSTVAALEPYIGKTVRHTNFTLPRKGGTLERVSVDNYGYCFNSTYTSVVHSQEMLIIAPKWEGDRSIMMVNPQMYYSVRLEDWKSNGSSFSAVIKQAVTGCVNLDLVNPTLEELHHHPILDTPPTTADNPPTPEVSPQASVPYAPNSSPTIQRSLNDAFDIAHLANVADVASLPHPPTPDAIPEANASRANTMGLRTGMFDKDHILYKVLSSSVLTTPFDKEMLQAYTTKLTIESEELNKEIEMSNKHQQELVARKRALDSEQIACHKHVKLAHVTSVLMDAMKLYKQDFEAISSASLQ